MNCENSFMKRVLLINPNTEQSPYPVVPIGLCLVAASLQSKYEVRILDATFDGATRLISSIGEMKPDYIGISIRNIDDVTLGVEQFYIDGIKRDFIRTIRAACKAPIILGGAGFNLFPLELVDQLGADFGVLGEGEERFYKLLCALDADMDPTSIPGVIIRGQRLHNVHESGTLSPSLHLPFSTVDQYVDFHPYRARGAYPIQTKRGCNLKCVYCCYPLIEGRSYRLRKPLEIVDEIEEAAARLGQVMFEFVDSTFNAPLAHAESVCREIIRRKLNLRLRSMGVNPGGITDRLLDLMRKAGFRQIVCSADTAATVTLRRYQKGFSKNKLEKAASLIKQHDMPTMWSFIFGGPGETALTIEESFEFIERFIQPLDMVHMTEGMRIYPNTPIFDVAVKEKIIDPSESLLKPVFYISTALGRERLVEIIQEKSNTHLNCIRSSESSVDEETMHRAVALRKEQQFDEPMFRTLLRIRRTAMK
jgi:radical SAM superfamily enzyme YgiQ (UPF0313 family)